MKNHPDLPIAAVANSYAAKMYDLEIVAKNIQDLAGNSTRFWLLGKEKKSFVKNLYNHNAIKTNAKRVFLSHYDDFFVPLSKPLRFINVSPRLIETMRSLDEAKPVGLITLFEKVEL